MGNAATAKKGGELESGRRPLASVASLDLSNGHI